jgi:pyruvate kinase
VEAVAMMHKIVCETEMQMRSEAQRYSYHAEGGLSIPETICESMAHAADDLDLTAIAVFTETGTTARLLSKYHPAPPIFALSSVEAVIRRMMLLWGVHPVTCPKLQHTDQMVDTAEGLLLDAGHVRAKQILGIVAGTRTRSGSTNFMRLHMVGDNDHNLSHPRESAKSKRVKPGPAKRSASAGAPVPTAARKTSAGKSGAAAAKQSNAAKNGRS